MLIVKDITLNANMADKIWSEFGPWFQQQRELAKVSQKKVATKAGIHVIQLSRIENGHSGVKRDTLERLLEAVNGLSSSHQVNLDQALNKAGFSGADTDTGISLDIADNVRVSMLHGENLTTEERRRFEIAFKAAYETVKEINDTATFELGLDFIAEGSIAPDDDPKPEGK